MRSENDVLAFCSSLFTKHLFVASGGKDTAQIDVDQVFMSDVCEMLSSLLETGVSLSRNMHLIPQGLTFDLHYTQYLWALNN